jgi:tRNA G18 (ribose-2'-O)-methylase SpoU
MEKSINQGGILRTADAFRLEKVYYEPEEDRHSDFMGATGIRPWQPMEWMNAHEVIQKSRQEGYTIYGLTLTEDAIALEHVEWKFPLALVLGKEKEGLPQEIAELCDVCVAIPLYGLMASLNVSVACGIVVHAAIHAYKQQNLDFTPARNVSRKLLGLTPIDYLNEKDSSLKGHSR